MRILVVDDDRRLCTVIKRGLLEEAYAVDLAYDGEEGEYLAEVNPYDLIILDIMLPSKDGIQVCHVVIEVANGGVYGRRDWGEIGTRHPLSGVYRSGVQVLEPSIVQRRDLVHGASIALLRGSTPTTRLSLRKNPVGLAWQ